MPDNPHVSVNQFAELQHQLTGRAYSRIFVLADENTRQHCYPLIQNHLPAHSLITIPPGEQHKTLATCETIWQHLTEGYADRHSLLINLGGGVIGDMGGFAAGCYKRGISFINLPTTLLAMVDASVGAKCGIDFNGYKNHLGLFNQPEAVFVFTVFLNTLSPRELNNGYAEVIKHYLIADQAAFYTLAGPGLQSDMVTLVQQNLAIKQAIVTRDPTEQNERKALNFGHTLGHALESFYLNSPLPLLHGEAVAMGMLAEAFISNRLNLLSNNELSQVVSTVTRYFTPQKINDADVEAILQLTAHDKKNQGTAVNFTLLKGIGSYCINNAVEKELMKDALLFINSL